MAVISQLWSTHSKHIQYFSNLRAFLELDLRDYTDPSQIEIWSFLDLIHDWLQEKKVQSFYVLLNRCRKEHWTPNSVIRHYQEFVCIERSTSILSGCSWFETLCSTPSIQDVIKSASAPLQTVAKQQQAAIIRTNRPLSLGTLTIPKPWGHEIWYTGVEKRGIAKVEDEWGSTELPYALSLFRTPFLNHFPEEVILLKTLNPVPEEVIGDLYLEMHEQKWEVYVVIDIIPSAWPSGIGKIKTGLNPTKVQAYQKEHGDAWKSAYMHDFSKAIASYEQIRREIDQTLDSFRQEAQIQPNAPLSPKMSQTFLNRIPKSQRIKEKALRDTAYNFVGNHEVKVGDVVVFTTHQMHALQHGIRVIEFQTAHYERLIVMFAQKVLTQNHWDTDEALSIVRPEVYQPLPLQEIDKTNAWHNERFVDFPDFTADRITIQPNEFYTDSTGGQYHLLIGVIGKGDLRISLSIGTIQPEQALFLPNSLPSYTVHNLSSQTLVYLKAMPK